MSVLHPFSKPKLSASAGTAESELEVMPADKAHHFSGAIKEKALVWIIQYVMDNLLRVPGTKARIGLTPFLEILPIFGDGATVLASAVSIVEGTRQGLPKIVLVRMAMNVLLNGVVGWIPFVGEVFSFWFKPSYRNFLLLQRHTTDPASGTRKRASTGDWVFVFGLLAVLFLAAGAIVAVGLYILWQALGILRRFQ